MLSSALPIHSSVYPSFAVPPVPVHKAVAPRQAELGAYGMRMAKHLHLSSAPMISVQTRRKAVLAVTRLRSATGLMERTNPIPSEPAFAVQLNLRPVSPVELWLRGQPSAIDSTQQEGSASIVDLQQAPSLYLGSPFDMVQFYLSRAALDEFADENHACRCETLAWPFGRPDPELRNLVTCILPLLDGRDSASELYADHLVFAAHAYIARTYGGIKPAPAIARGGLAPWQLQRATEILRANLDGQIALSRVAQECKLSVSHFVRAFKQTVGEPPHRWLLQQRIALARELLLRSGLPMAEIALHCGFADQACLIRAFRKLMDTTPGEWRRVRMQ